MCTHRRGRLFKDWTKLIEFTIGLGTDLSLINAVVEVSLVALG